MFSPEVWMGGVSFPVRLLCKLSLPLIAGRDCLLSSSLPPSEQITKRSMFYSDNGANVEKNCKLGVEAEIHLDDGYHTKSSRVCTSCLENWV